MIHKLLQSIMRTHDTGIAIEVITLHFLRFYCTKKLKEKRQQRFKARVQVGGLRVGVLASCARCLDRFNVHLQRPQTDRSSHGLICES